MPNIAAILTKIQKTSGRNAKEAILRNSGAYPMFKEVVKFLYDPYVKTGIGRAKLKNAEYINDAQEQFIDWEEIMDYLRLNQTGKYDDVCMAKTFVDQFEEGSDAYAIAEGLVTKTLKIGITATTLNKVYGESFIPLMGIMKAETYDDFKGKVSGPFIVTEKLDGARRVILKENGHIMCRTRSGHEDPGLEEIVREMAMLPDNCVYDGELLAVGDFDNAIELRQASNSIANRKGVRTGLTFNVFDMIPLADYKLGESTHTAIERKVMLSAMFGDVSIECLVPTNYRQLIEEYQIDFEFEHVQVVPILGTARTEEEVMKMAEQIWRRGFEGVMLNTFTGKYNIKKDRSRDILKVKNIEEHVLTVVDIEEGKEGHQNENKVGALIVDYKGYRVGVGMGLTQDQRTTWWQDPTLIVGKRIELECFGESQNKQGGLSLNCSVFKRIVGAG